MLNFFLFFPFSYRFFVSHCFCVPQLFEPRTITSRHASYFLHPRGLLPYLLRPALVSGRCSRYFGLPCLGHVVGVCVNENKFIIRPISCAGSWEYFTVDASIQRLEDYKEKHERGLITAIRKDTDNTIDNRMTITRKQNWEEKRLYGRFKRLINNISKEKKWIWLRKGNFKRETESLLRAAQNNAIRTNHIKSRIDKTQQNSKCRLWGDRDETINHIISDCN